VLDTGIAYRNWQKFKKMPDFGTTRFVDPYDFVAGNRDPLDRNGHGTFVAAEIAESTDNGIGLTGLAYGVSVMPVRILDALGNGDAVTISRGIRYAVNHGAQVINLSLEFNIGIMARDIPEIIGALTYAQRRGVVVVAAAGNEGLNQLAYPAADATVISVGATTRDECLADYSNFGPELNLVAPGGGDDAMLTQPNCQPFASLPPIYQETLANATASLTKFGYPGGIYGTSMAAPEVSATAALVLASGVIGHHPTPAQVLQRLEQTAQPLGGTVPNQTYGYGMLDAAAATSSTTVPTSSTTVPT
jgi:serine protease